MAPFRSRRLSTQIQVIRAVPRVQQVALFGLWDSQTTWSFFLGILCRFPSTSNMKVLIRPRGWVAAGRLSGVSKKTATGGNYWADSISISFWWGGGIFRGCVFFSWRTTSSGLHRTVRSSRWQPETDSISMRILTATTPVFQS